MDGDDNTLTLAECFTELFGERANSCDYYISGEYSEHVNKALALEQKISKRLGKKLFKVIRREVFELDALRGEQLACLQSSCYRRGFQDALILAREMNQAGKGLPNIFK